MTTVTKTTHRPRRQLMSGSLLAVCLVIFSASATPETEYDLERSFARALMNRGNLDDYAEKQIAYLNTQFRRQRWSNILVEAEYLLKQRKVQDANKLLEEIPKDSPEYVLSIVLRIQVLRESSERIAAFKDYFAAVKSPKGEQETNDYRNMVMRYVHELLALGRYDEAARTLKLLENLSDAADATMNRRIQLRTAQILLRSAEDALSGADKTEREMASTNDKAEKDKLKKSMDDQRKQANVLLNQAISKLEELVWIQDYVATLAYPELMHGYNLRGESEKAISTFNSSYELMKNAEQELMEQMGDRSASPLPHAFFYLAESYMVQAKASREKEPKTRPPTGPHAERTLQLMTNAAKLYIAVFRNYPDSPRQAEALQQFEFINTVRTSVYEVEALSAPGGQAQSAKVKTAHDIFREGNHALAARNYLEAIAMDPTTPEAADALVMAASCYRQLQLWWEGMMAVDLLMELHPTSGRTGDTVYNLGLAFYRQSKQEADEAAAELMEKRGIHYLTLFVEIAPTHPRAAMTAYTIAETSYAKAGQLRTEARELEAQGAPVRSINEKIAQAKEAYSLSVPLYESVVLNHAISDNAVQALYKLGWVYQILEQHEKSATSFLAYSKREEDPAKKVGAVYFAADNFMRGGNPDEAISNFKQVIAWSDTGGAYAGKDPQIETYRLQSQILLPWAYDAKKDQLIAQIARNKELIEQLKAEALAKQDAPEEEEVDLGDSGEAPLGTGFTPEQLAAANQELQQKVNEFRTLTIQGLEVQRQGSNMQEKPNAMAKLGTLYGELQDFESAAKVLGELDAQFPETPAGQQALFTLFRSYLQTDNRAKANEVATRMIDRLPGYNINNVVFIASRLFETNRKLETSILNPELALAANEEILKRAKAAKRGDPDFDLLQQQEPRAHYNRALSFLLSNRPEQAIAAANEYQEKYPSGGYFFDAAILRAKALRQQGNFTGALAELGDILNKIDRARLEATYFEVLVESARTLMAMNDKERVRGATVRLVPLLALGSAESETGTIWLEAATYEITRAYALLGDDARVSQYRSRYQDQYRRGAWWAEIHDLPAPL